MNTIFSYFYVIITYFLIRSSSQLTESSIESEGIVPQIPVAANNYYTDQYYQPNDPSKIYSNDFTVQVGARTIDMSPIASTGQTDENGILLQRVFAFSSPSGYTSLDNWATYNCYFRVPVAGRPRVVLSMAINTITWDNHNGYNAGPTDAFATDDGGPTSVSFGVYDGSTWVQLSDGSLQVQYTAQNEYSLYQQGDCYEEMTVTFKCSNTAALVYEHYEEPACQHFVTVSSSTFCAAATLPNPARPPTRTPTQTPFVIPIVQASSASAPGNYCISLFLSNDTEAAWNSTAMDVLNVDGLPYYQLQPGCSLPYANSKYCFSSNAVMQGSFLVTRVAVFQHDDYWLISWKSKDTKAVGGIYYGQQITPMVYAQKPPPVDGVVTSKIFVGACM